MSFTRDTTLIEDSFTNLVTPRNNGVSYLMLSLAKMLHCFTKIPILIKKCRFFDYNSTVFTPLCFYVLEHSWKTLLYIRRALDSRHIRISYFLWYHRKTKIFTIWWGVFAVYLNKFYILVCLRPRALIKDSFMNSTSSRHIRVSYFLCNHQKTMIFHIRILRVFLRGWELDALYMTHMH